MGYFGAGTQVPSQRRPPAQSEEGRWKGGVGEAQSHIEDYSSNSAGEKVHQEYRRCVVRRHSEVVHGGPRETLDVAFRIFLFCTFLTRMHFLRILCSPSVYFCLGLCSGVVYSSLYR